MAETITHPAAGESPGRRRNLPSLSAVTGVRRVPPPRNEPVKAYAPGLAGEGRAEGAPGRHGRRADRHPADHRRPGGPHRPDRAGGDAARPPATCWRTGTGRRASTSSRRSRRPPRRTGSGRTGPGRTGRPCFLKAAELLATTWRRHAQRRHDARPVQDRLPGRDRRRLRDDRLLPLQPPLRAGAVRRAADLGPHDVEPARLPARWRGSCTRSRRSTSRPSAATCPPRPRSWATR